MRAPDWLDYVRSRPELFRNTHNPDATPEGNTPGSHNPTIFADPAMADEHLAFMAYVHTQGIDYGKLSAEEFEEIKHQWRQSK